MADLGRLREKINNPVKLKQKIGKKVFLLLIVPLVLQIALLSALFNLLTNNIDIIQREKNLSQSITNCAQEITLMNQCMDLFGHYALSSGEFRQSKEGKGYLQQANEKYDQLRQLGQSDPKVARQISPFFEEIEKSVVVAIDLAGPVGTPDPQTNMKSLVNKLTSLKVFFKISENINSAAVERMKTEQDALNQARAVFQENRNKMIIIIFLLFGAQILVTFAAGSTFAKNLTGRLNILVDNAYRLPRGMELEKKVEGSDELTFLDEALHEAEEYLKDASEQRTLIMEMIAHDMRSPLMSAQIASELVFSMAHQAPEPVRRNLGAIQRNLGVVVNLVNDLLTIDRLESGALELVKERVDVNALLEDAIQGVEAIATAKQISLANASEPGVYALIDHDRIVQVVTNLITNAIKFSPKGSTITVAAQDNQRFAQISISDQGPGLPPGSEKKIFEKFHQVQREHASKGYGLGLTICKMIVELHGGTIAAQSLPQKGSRFFFSVPRAKA